MFHLKKIKEDNSQSNKTNDEIITKIDMISIISNTKKTKKSLLTQIGSIIFKKNNWYHAPLLLSLSCFFIINAFPSYSSVISLLFHCTLYTFIDIYSIIFYVLGIFYGIHTAKLLQKINESKKINSNLWNKCLLMSFISAALISIPTFTSNTNDYATPGNYSGSVSVSANYAAMPNNSLSNSSIITN